MNDESEYDLRHFVSSCGGCAAKWDAGDLASMLSAAIGKPRDDVIVGLDPFDDAAVTTWNSDEHVISTVDFFPAIVSDPKSFGRIGAANACSDIYAMGGRVVSALAIAAFPAGTPSWVLRDTIAGAVEVLEACDGVLIGGHTIQSAEPIFGLAVTGAAQRDALWRKSGANPGDVVILSKPIGSGLVLNSMSDRGQRDVIDLMGATNREAAENLMQLPLRPSSVTDVSGFGLLGHAFEIAMQSGLRINIELDAVPMFDGAISAAEAGEITGGGHRNSSFLHTEYGYEVISTEEIVMADPQTSGGLLATIPPDVVAAVDTNLFWIIGECTDDAIGVGIK